MITNYYYHTLFSRTTWVSHYQKEKTILDFNEARDVGMVVASAGPHADHLHFAPDNHTGSTSFNFFYGSDALSDAQPTASKH